MTLAARVLAPAAAQSDAALIPETAAGRDHLFFFGTLMHHEVLERVLDRRVLPHELRPATLGGFRRERAAQASYPVLVADPAASVAGRLLCRPSRRCIRRINHFEDEEYHARRLTVASHGASLAAWVFLPLEHVPMMQPSGEPWDLESWAVAHLDAYRQAITRWMVGVAE